MDVASLDTPFATVDLDAVERNIARMQAYCDEHGLSEHGHVDLAACAERPDVGEVAVHRGKLR